MELYYLINFPLDLFFYETYTSKKTVPDKRLIDTVHLVQKHETSTPGRP